MTSSRTNTRRSRRLAAGLALAAVASTFGAGLAPGTSSANEFEPKPTAEIALSCVGSPHLEVTLGNVHGLDHAPFLVTVKHTATFSYVDTQDIQAGDSKVFTYSVSEGENILVEVTSDGGSALASLTANVDCSPPLHATITPECGLYQDLLVYHFDNTELVDHEVDFHYPAGAETPDVNVTVAAGQSFEEIVKSAEDAPIGAGEATITVDGIVLTSFEGTPDCVNPQASISLVCPADGDPEIVYALSNDGPTYVGIASFLDGDLVVNTPLKGEITTVTATVAEDAAFDATAISMLDQTVLADLTGVADCDEPDVPEIPEVPEVPQTTTIPAPVPEPTTIPVAGPAPAPVLVLSSEAAAPATAVAVSPHFTG